MEAPAQTSEEGLCAAILAEAHQECAHVLALARKQKEAVVADAVAEASRLKKERLARARAEADHCRELISATLPIEVARKRRSAIEALLETVHKSVRSRCEAAQDLESPLRQIALASDAIGRMQGDSFVVKLRRGPSRSEADGLARAIATGVGRSGLRIAVVEDLTIQSDGVLVRDTLGHQVWDNTCLARLERLWPELRRQIAVRVSLVPPARTRGGN